MNGMPVESKGELIGKIEQFLFDDRNWAVRYIVTDVGNRLSGKRVLLSPAAVEKHFDETLKIKISKEQVMNSPDIDTAGPVTRRMEIELHDYYSWPYYWVFPSFYNSLGGAMYPGLTSPSGFMPSSGEKVLDEREILRESHLRSTREMTGFMVQAIDENVGKIDDFLIETNEWVVRYILVDTGTAHRRVILSPGWTRGIDWEERIVYAGHRREIIQNGPAYYAEEEIDRDFENRLYDYYQQPKYWIEE